MLQTLPVAHPDARQAGRVLQERVAQRRLAGATLPFDEHEPAFRRRDGREGVFESRKVGVVIDEDRRNRRALPFARGQRRVRDGRQEHVAATRLAANELWIARVVSERAAQLADENFDVLGLNVGIGPDAREDVLMRHQGAGPLDQARQHIGRFARDLDLTGAAPEGAAGSVESIGQKILHAGMRMVIKNTIATS